MKRNLFIVWSLIHLSIAFLFSAYWAYEKYCLFYSKPLQNIIKKIAMTVSSNSVVRGYGEITEATSNFGFFAPNVKSTGFVAIECNGKVLLPKFQNAEARIRFSQLESKTTDYIVNDYKSSPVMENFYNLMFRSVAIKIYNDNNCQSPRFTASYQLLEFPPLAAYKNGYKNYELVKIKELRLSR